MDHSKNWAVGHRASEKFHIFYKVVLQHA